MSAPYIILDNSPSLCQKLSDLVEVWRSYNKNNFACFFETWCKTNRERLHHFSTMGSVVQCDCEVSPAATVYQRQLSLPSLLGCLMSTSELWVVNGHTTQWTSHVYVVLHWIGLSSVLRPRQHSIGYNIMGDGF